MMTNGTTYLAFLLALIIVVCLIPECSGLAGRGQRRRSRTTAAVEYNSATATPLDSNDKRDLEVLWGMAGRTSRRKQRNGRKATPLLRQDSIFPTNNVNAGQQQESSLPAIQDKDIKSIHIDSPLQVTIALTNGTTYEANPQDFHQRSDFAVWMKTRQQLDMSASELSAVVNNSYFSNRDQLLQKKAGLTKTTFVQNSKACQWGLKMEPQALRQYCQVTGNAVEETGLWMLAQTTEDSSSLWLGASPDGIVTDKTTNTTGLLEIKSLWGRRHKKELPQFDHCPNRFWDQIQGQLAVTDKEWCDLMLYIPPTHRHRKNYCILRVDRNRDYWDKTLLPAVEQFCADVHKLKQKQQTS